MASNEPSCVVLAGGYSRRMGNEKARLPFLGQPLLRRVLQRLATLTDDLLVATSGRDSYADILEGLAVRAVTDSVTDAGPLAGICAGLEAARRERVIVVACDMPFVNVELLRWMADLLPGHAAVVPNAPIARLRVSADSDAVNSPSRNRAKDQALHPLHAVYSRSCVALLGTMLAEGSRSAGDFVSRLSPNVRIVAVAELAIFDPRLLSLRNVNTPEELTECQKLAEQQ